MEPIGHAPELRARWHDDKEQPAAVGQLELPFGWLGTADLCVGEWYCGYRPDSRNNTRIFAGAKRTTIRRLSGKRIVSQTACSMTSAGNRSPRSMDSALVIIALEEPMFVDTSST
jgi:hypothetical protein